MSEREFGDLGARLKSLERYVEVEVDRLRDDRHDLGKQIQRIIADLETVIDLAKDDAARVRTIEISLPKILSDLREALDFAKKHEQGIESNARISIQNAEVATRALALATSVDKRTRSLEDWRIWLAGIVVALSAVGAAIKAFVFNH